MGAPTNTGADVYEAVCALFDQLYAEGRGIRLLGVRAGQLSRYDGGVQLTLGDDGRRSKAEEAMDLVRAKYGRSVLKHGSLLEKDSEV